MKLKLFYFIATFCVISSDSLWTVNSSYPFTLPINDQCYVMAQYFARVGKPLNNKSIALLDKSICQRFDAVIRKNGVLTVDRKLRNRLIIRQMTARYQRCMKRYNFIQYCHRFVINSNCLV